MTSGSTSKAPSTPGLLPPVFCSLSLSKPVLPMMPSVKPILLLMSPYSVL